MKALIIDKQKNSVEVDISLDLWKALNVDISKAKKNNTKAELTKSIDVFLGSDNNGE